MERGRPGWAVLFPCVVASVLMMLPVVPHALEIPFVEMLTGRGQRSLIDDAPHYPSSYVSLELRGWDIYHERRDATLHDYQQDAQHVVAIYRTGNALLGAAVGREALGLRQENVYTDADRLNGGREQKGGKLLAGYHLARDMPLGLTRAEIIAGAGSNGEFLGDVELQLDWGDRVSILAKAELFSSEIVTTEEINGARFPFHFPLRTSRVFGRLQVVPRSGWRLRAHGTYGESVGDGDVVEGFENRLYFERYGGAITLDYRLAAHHRLFILPVLEGTGRVPGFRVRAEHTSGDGHLGMRFDGVRYLLLDGLETGESNVRLDVVPWSWLTLLGGWQRLRLQHSGASFVDVWPFVIWDVFQAKRYRLDQLDAQLDIWYAGVGGRYDSGRFLVELAGRFEWWDDQARLEWLERIDILFPFFFRFERHAETPVVSATNAVQLDASVWFRFGGGSAIRVSGRATAPFSTGDGSTDPVPPGGGTPPGAVPSGPDPSTHGGLSGTLELVLRL